MRYALGLAALIAPLCGCVVPPDGGYGQAPPAPPGGYYAQPGYPYPPPGYGQPPAYSGYQEYGGQPAYYDGAASYPLVLLGGEWGYYDRDRHWRRAPEDVHRRMEDRRAGGGPGRPEAPRAAPGRPEPPRAAPGRPDAPRAFPASAPARAVPPQAPPPRREEHERRRECPRDQPRC